MFETASAPIAMTADVVGFSALLQSLDIDTDGDTGSGHGNAAGAGFGVGTAGAGLIDQTRALEELKSAAAAAQARATERFAADQRAVQRAAGMSARNLGKGVAAQVALARRDSPVKGARHLGLAEALVREMPHTLAALEAGLISEWRATLIVRETACLSVEHRGQVDAELAARPGGLGAMGDRACAVEARRIGYRLDPHAVTNRARKAEADRRVSLRPAPDTMTWFTGLLPAKQGVAAYAALRKHADTRSAAGDERSRGQIMADTLVERVTGQTTADAVPVEVNLHLNDDTLLDDDPDHNAEPADLAGYGPIPAPLVRDWLRGDHASGHTAGPSQSTDPVTDPVAAQAEVWLRRLYANPESGQLVAMESAQRCFDGTLRRFVIARDRVCRTPWCDAPIRHVDHPVAVVAGGQTTAANGQGLCEACNYSKQAPGWRARVCDDGTVETITPTGHRYSSRPPPGIGRPPPAWPSPAGAGSRVETYFRDFILAV